MKRIQYRVLTTAHLANDSDGMTLSYSPVDPFGEEQVKILSAKRLQEDKENVVELLFPLGAWETQDLIEEIVESFLQNH